MNDFLKSRAGIVFLAFLAISGFLLAYEHRMHLFSGTGILVALLAVCVGMHLFMHGGHGGHGGGREGHRNSDGRDEDGKKE
tara:strand:+ start:1581 stop:1823 length:243 start_codon:yes stop_codon:yes gene_type:complete